MAEGLHPVLNSFPWTAKEQKEKDKVLYMLAAPAAASVGPAIQPRFNSVQG
jgi:hypothetical protein